MQTKPTKGNIVVKGAKAESMSEGGLFLPMGKADSNRGVVVATHEESEFKRGDQVVFLRKDFASIAVGDDNFLFMAEDNILCVLDFSDE